MLELPTGTGKTVCFAELGREYTARGKRVLVLAHREELLDQGVRKFADVGVWAAVEQGSRRAGSAPVVIASVQTMRGDRLERFARTAFDLVIVDEGHHGAATSYRNILEYFDTARVLFVTATPDRADGKALGEICQSVAYRLSMREAVEMGALVPMRARRVLVDGVDISRVSVRAGDFAQEELATAFAEESALHGTAVPLLQLSADRRTIAFCVNVAHAKALAEMLNRYEPGVARAVDGKASSDERRTVLDAFRRGEFRVLVNCALYTEGFDEPSIACVAIVRPTKSRALHCQMLGRGTRLFPGKSFCLVLDFVGNSGRHSLVGPADALAAGSIDDEMRAEIERLLALEEHANTDVQQLLVVAEDELAKKRRSVKFLAVTEYRVREVDPYLAPYMRKAPEMPRPDDALTDNQRRALASAGLENLPASLTKAEASQWLDAIAQRERLGLCSLKMARALEKANFDTKGMLAVRAKQLFTKLVAAGYKHPLLSSEPEYKAGWKKRAK